MGGLFVTWYSPPMPLLAVPNVTAHPSTGSVPSTVLLVEFYLYPTVGTVLIHSVKPELTE